MQVAQKTRSTEFCKELKNSDQKESCTFAIVMLDVQEKGTIELCDSLSDTFKKTCINQGYRALALAKKDPTLCKKIPEPQKAGTGSSAPTAGMYNEQAQCIMNVIMSDPNAKATDCSKIQDASLKTMCETALEQRATLRPPQTSAPTSSSSTSSKTRNTSSGERNVSDF
jgi:23S rRNA U2552 (ribose-2'-O)-methylase RlmE/FtsJ